MTTFKIAFASWSVSGLASLQQNFKEKTNHAINSEQTLYLNSNAVKFKLLLRCACTALVSA